ncbi:MAG TPA: acetate kinase, partial [Blastocatellia bacterium]
MKILALNSGSSSQKIRLYEIGEALHADPPACLWEGKIEGDGEDAIVVIKNSGGVSRQDRVKAPSRAQAVESLLSAVWGGETRALVSASEIEVVGHR